MKGRLILLLVCVSATSYKATAQIDYFNLTSFRTGLNVPQIFVPKLGGYGDLSWQNYGVLQNKDQFSFDMGIKASIKTAKNNTMINPSINSLVSRIDYSIKKTDSIAIIDDRINSDHYLQTILGRASTDISALFNLQNYEDDGSKGLQLSVGIPFSLYFYSVQRTYKNIQSQNSDTVYVPKYSRIVLNKLDSTIYNTLTGMVGINGGLRYQDKRIGWDAKIGIHKILWNSSGLIPITQSRQTTFLTVEQDLLFKEFDFGVDFWLNVQVKQNNPSWGIFFYKRFDIEDLIK